MSCITSTNLKEYSGYGFSSVQSIVESLVHWINRASWHSKSLKFNTSDLVLVEEATSSVPFNCTYYCTKVCPSLIYCRKTSFFTTQIVRVCISDHWNYICFFSVRKAILWVTFDVKMAKGLSSVCLKWRLNPNAQDITIWKVHNLHQSESFNPLTI